MGLTFVEGTVVGKKGKKAVVKFMVDSGAVYSLLPQKDWQAIGLKRKRTMTFTLADGTTLPLAMSHCSERLPWKSWVWCLIRSSELWHRCEVCLSG